MAINLVNLGLIPAHAGSTQVCSVVRIVDGAHPRSRGEHESGAAPLDTDDGSSPLTRGAPQPPS